MTLHLFVSPILPALWNKYGDAGLVPGPEGVPLLLRAERAIWGGSAWWAAVWNNSTAAVTQPTMKIVRQAFKMRASAPTANTTQPGWSGFAREKSDQIPPENCGWTLNLSGRFWWVPSSFYTSLFFFRWFTSVSGFFIAHKFKFRFKLKQKSCVWSRDGPARHMWFFSFSFISFFCFPFSQRKNLNFEKVVFELEMGQWGTCGEWRQRWTPLPSFVYSSVCIVTKWSVLIWI